MPYSVRSWLSGIALAALLVPAAARADEFGIDLAVGRSVQRDGDRLLGVGVNAHWQPQGWWLRPEIGYETKLFPFFSGEDEEFSAGLRSEWPLGNSRVWVGGGYARLGMHWGANSDRTEGWYARLGTMWPVGQSGFHMGLEGKLVRAADFHPWDTAVRAGSWRYGLLLGWRI